MLARRDVRPQALADQPFALSLNVVRVGLTYQFGGPAARY
jgi:hypothetical protein